MVCSKFGNLFRKAADATAAQVKHDGFDLSVIEIKKEDLRKVYGPSVTRRPILPFPVVPPRFLCFLEIKCGFNLTAVVWSTDYLSVHS